MEQVDILLSGGIVISMDAAFTLIFDGAVAIRGSEIVAVGEREALTAQYTAHEVVDCSGQYVMPGLVNAHTHVPMTLLRGLADDRRLDVWLMGYMMPTEREFVSPEFCRLGAQLACAEQIRSGITSFADMYYYEAEIAQATADAGMRGVLGQTILKFPAPDADSYEDSLAYARQFIETWRGHPLITPAVAPHAPYSSTEDLLRQSAALAIEYDVPVLIHIAETRQEVDDSLQERDQRVVDYVNSVGLLDAKVLAAHCVHIKISEMHTLREHNCTVAHCPTSNLKLASGIAPVTDMLKFDVTVGIGTDGPASNNDLDMIEEIRLAAILAKTAANDPTALPARQALLMATRQGAEALYLGDVTGSLEPGKLADIVMMDCDGAHNSPRFRRDPNAVYSEIVYASKSTDVAHVMCHGRWLMRDRELLTLDEEALKQRARDYAVKIDVFLAAHEGDIFSKLLAVTQGMERGESFEVQTKAILRDASGLERLLSHPDVQILKMNHYRQYDTYFEFDRAEVGRLRYREDDLLDDKGEAQAVRSRLTLTMPTKENTFHSSVLLSHSRFIAPADRPLRFYREYFQPVAERELQKDRRRWHLHYQGVLFYLNVDQVLRPEAPDTFIEIKSRTWSAMDAENKAYRIQQMLGIMGVPAEDIILTDYLEMEGLPD
ncbi:MAG: amidohydrolase family protein [Anaerolineae bacterium]|nr:amidohydrolase family protein [Anaerolineae bacterium]